MFKKYVWFACEFCVIWRGILDGFCQVSENFPQIHRWRRCWEAKVSQRHNGNISKLDLRTMRNMYIKNLLTIILTHPLMVWPECMATSRFPRVVFLRMYAGWTMAFGFFLLWKWKDVLVFILHIIHTRRTVGVCYYFPSIFVEVVRLDTGLPTRDRAHEPGRGFTMRTHPLPNPFPPSRSSDCALNKTKSGHFIGLETFVVFISLVFFPKIGIYKSQFLAKNSLMSKSISPSSKGTLRFPN